MDFYFGAPNRSNKHIPALSYAARIFQYICQASGKVARVLKSRSKLIQGQKSAFWMKLLVNCFLILAVQACSTGQAGLPGAANTPANTPTPNSASLKTLSGDNLVEIPMQVGYGVRGKFYEIYFTDPHNPNSYLDEGGPDVPLATAINAARNSVDVAAYSISLYSIQTALIHAFNRGVKVRMVMESDNMGEQVPQALLGAGIPIVGDGRPGLMHDKFMVIDHSEVWTGSMNFTTSGTYQDNNNLVRIRSEQVAQDYTVEFDEMFEENFFGPDAIAATPFPSVTIDGTPLEIYFSPDDHVANRIVTLLRGASESINFLAYSFTVKDFGDILLQKAHDGVHVSGVMETDQVKSNPGYSEFTVFSKAGLPVYLDGNQGLMHHKVIIIDNEIVITGSYNFTVSAEKTNDENVVIFFDKKIAAYYTAEFQRVYDQASKSVGDQRQ